MDDTLKGLTLKELCELKENVLESLSDIELAIEIKAKRGDID